MNPIICPWRLLLPIALASVALSPLGADWDDSWERVETGQYSIESRFWGPRIRHMVVKYVPYTMDFIENDRSPRKKVFARFKAVAERRAGKAVPNPSVHNWAEAAVYNTFESMCWALLVDPMGDSEMLAAQQRIREGIERWIPVILQAQEEDGYLCTDVQMRGFPRFVSPMQGTSGKVPEAFSEDHHEGYMMGYFIEAAIAHFMATGGKDLRVFHAAKNGADLFCNTIGDAPKLAWQPDHPGLEQALARFALLAETVEGKGSGDRYKELAKWLLMNRGVTPPHTDGFRQKDKPLSQQMQPYGHAVMWGYLYAGAADVARLAKVQSLADSSSRLWEALVGSKMYLTGAMGSKDESFEKPFVLPNGAKLGETCANIANLFFQANMGLLTGEARFADVAELALYNGVLGSVALDEATWQYFNPLDQSGWPTFPMGRHNKESDCCMSNISRTLLRLPTWIYARREKALAINQFVGSRVVLPVAGTNVEVVQTTDYPWKGQVKITLNPAEARTFALHIRVPSRQVSALCTGRPKVGGFTSVLINGMKTEPRIERGYYIVERFWKKGDQVELAMPMEIQRVRADQRVVAEAGRVALRYGPLIYNFESIDLPKDKSLEDLALAEDAPLNPVWEEQLLGGVVAIKGAFSDGTPLQAIPNYARMNRMPKRDVSTPAPRSLVWIRASAPPER